MDLNQTYLLTPEVLGNVANASSRFKDGALLGMAMTLAIISVAACYFYIGYRARQIEERGEKRRAFLKTLSPLQRLAYLSCHKNPE